MSYGDFRNAEQEVLFNIDQMLAENANALTVPMTTVNNALAELVNHNGKAVARVTSRLLRSIGQQTTRTDDSLNALTTGVLGNIDAWLQDTQFFLTQLANKGGLTSIGEPLATALTEEVTRGGQLEYQGTLVLAIKEAVPYIKEFIQVLREIRDRMPPLIAPQIDPAEFDQEQAETSTARAAGEWTDLPGDW